MKIAVVGGGIGGLAFAIILKRLNPDISPVVYEAAGKVSQSGGCVIIAPNGMRVLKTAGVSELVEQRGHRLRFTHFFDKLGKKIVSRGIGDPEVYGDETILIRRSVLLDILLEKALADNIQVEFSSAVGSVSDEGDQAVLSFRDGRELGYDFVVGSDGAHSKVRDSVVSEAFAARYSGFIYLAGFCPRSVTREVSESSNDSLCVTYCDVGFFGSAEFPDGDDKGFLYWYCYVKEDLEISKKELRDRGNSWVCEKVLSNYSDCTVPVKEYLDNTDEFCVTNIYDLDSLPNWSKGRVLLIGDAAHALNPIAGQGASTALEDAEVLARLFKRLGADPSGVVRSFESIRRPRVEKVCRSARRSNSLLKRRGIGSLRLLRNFAYRLIHVVIPERKLNSDFFYSAKSAEENWVSDREDRRE